MEEEQFEVEETLTNKQEKSKKHILSPLTLGAISVVVLLCIIVSIYAFTINTEQSASLTKEPSNPASK